MARFIQVKQNAIVYAVPLTELSPESFHEFDFILSFFGQCFDSLFSIESSLYLQLLAHFMKFPSFVEKITPEMVAKLSQSPLPFHSLFQTWTYAHLLQFLEEQPECCGFGMMGLTSSVWTSYISPQLQPNAVIQVSFKYTGEPAALFGVVTDTVEPRFTRYSMVEVPSGTIWPSLERSPPIPDPLEIDFEINAKDRSLKWATGVAPFPLGPAFRIIIALKKESTVEISVDQSAWIKDSPPVVCEQRAPASSFAEALFQLPEIVARMPGLPKELPAIHDLIRPIPESEKVLFSYADPPFGITSHIALADYSSACLVEALRRGLFGSLALQFATVCLMRIAIFKSDLLVNPTELFVLLMVPLEPFSSSAFIERRLPFSLGSPVWENSNFLCLSLEIDAKECLRKLSGIARFRRQFCDDLLRMCENRYVHLVCFPHLCHDFYAVNSHSDLLQIRNQFSIVTVNSFEPVHTFTNTATGKREQLSLIVFNGPIEIVLALDFMQQPISVFNISPDDNRFVFGTAFEALLLLKNLVFIV
jgi:hypothetical protein